MTVSINTLLDKATDGLARHVRVPVVALPEVLHCTPNLSKSGEPTSVKVHTARDFAEATWMRYRLPRGPNYRFFGNWRGFLVVSLIHPPKIQDLIQMAMSVPFIRWRKRSLPIGRSSYYFNLSRSLWTGVCGYDIAKCDMPCIFFPLWLPPDRLPAAATKFDSVKPTKAKKQSDGGLGSFNFLACLIPTAETLQSCQRSREGSSPTDQGDPDEPQQ